MSYAKLDAKLILEKCNSWIHSRENRIKDLQEPHVQKLMKGSWFRKPMSREDAIKELGHNLWSDYVVLKIAYGYDAERIIRLKDLCLLAGNSDVNVSADDASILSYNWDN